ncbi:GntR family transcriptional regulator [Ochrobactrum tritici]|uniref:GntR family transcriptional regulator n=1 Tax=Brucella tritici TaxID=94626 RepID=A0A7X6FRL9_9HYPH|nr:GntR family transcriptional regulator [Brucella tritici]
MIQVAESVRLAILEGRWSRGERLPNEADLADDLKVSRATLREAIGMLVLPELSCAGMDQALLSGTKSGSDGSVLTGTALVD